MAFPNLYYKNRNPIFHKSPMMWTFDKINLSRRPPPFSYPPWKNLGRRVCVDREENTFCFYDSAVIFFFRFQEHER